MIPESCSENDQRQSAAMPAPQHAGGRSDRPKPVSRVTRSSALATLRFLLACPFLLAGIGLVLAGRILLEREDRRGFDRQYFGPREQPASDR
jgi:hypothetical protein